MARKTESRCKVGGNTPTLSLISGMAPDEVTVMYMLIVFSCCTYILQGILLSCPLLQMIIGEKQALGQSVDDELASLQLTSSSRTHSRAATAASRAASRSASRAGSARVAAGSRPVTSSPPPNAAAAVSPRTQPTAAAADTATGLV